MRVQRTPSNQIPTKTVPVYFCARRDVYASQGRNQTSRFQYGATRRDLVKEIKETRPDRAAFYGSVRRANCVNNNLNARVATTKDEQSRSCRGRHSATNRRRPGQVLSMNNML